MTYTFISEQCSDLPVSVCCRVMGVSTSGYYQRASQPVTDRELAEAHMANTVFDIWKMSRHSYGMPRVRDELRLGMAIGCSRTRVAQLMAIGGAVGTHYRRKGGCTRRDDSEPSADLVNRAFDPKARTGCGAWTSPKHHTSEGKVYLAVVLDAWSRRVAGWSIADHIRAELVADAVQMAAWRRQPPKDQTIAHSDHGSQYLFGRPPPPPGLSGTRARSGSRKTSQPLAAGGPGPKR